MFECVSALFHSISIISCLNIIALQIFISHQSHHTSYNYACQSHHTSYNYACLDNHLNLPCPLPLCPPSLYYTSSLYYSPSLYYRPSSLLLAVTIAARHVLDHRLISAHPAIRTTCSATARVCHALTTACPALQLVEEASVRPVVASSFSPSLVVSVGPAHLAPNCAPFQQYSNVFLVFTCKTQSVFTVSATVSPVLTPTRAHSAQLATT